MRGSNATSLNSQFLPNTGGTLSGSLNINTDLTVSGKIRGNVLNFDYVDEINVDNLPINTIARVSRVENIPSNVSPAYNLILTLAWQLDWKYQILYNTGDGHLLTRYYNGVRRVWSDWNQILNDSNYHTILTKNILSTTKIDDDYEDYCNNYAKNLILYNTSYFSENVADMDVILNVYGNNHRFFRLIGNRMRGLFFQAQDPRGNFVWNKQKRIVFEEEITDFVTKSDLESILSPEQMNQLSSTIENRKLEAKLAQEKQIAELNKFESQE